MTELIATSCLVGEIPESFLYDWFHRQSIEIRPRLPAFIDRGATLEYDVVLCTGIEGCDPRPESLQATLSVRLYDNGRHAMVEVGLKVFSPDVG